MKPVDKSQWVERGAKWEDIKFRMEFANWHKKSELKVFEAYYVKGKEPNLSPLDPDPIPLVYRLWLSPDQSLSAWINITEVFLAGPERWTTKVSVESTGDGSAWKDQLKEKNWGWQRKASLRDSYEILVQLCTATDMDGATCYVGSSVVPPLGYMGGVEKRIYEFLTGQTPGSEGFIYAGEKLFQPPRYYGHMVYRNLCIWLDGKRSHNPYSIYNYMGRFWVDTFDEQRMADVESDELVSFYLTCYLRLLARNQLFEAGSERSEHCELVRGLLEEQAIPPAFRDMWRDAKEFKGHINLNEQYNDEPYIIGERFI